MKDEFNRISTRNDFPAEDTKFIETAVGTDNPSALEFGDCGPSLYVKKKKGGIGRTLSVLSAAIAAVVSVTMLAPAVVGGEKTSAAFAQLSATDTEIGYRLDLGNSAQGELKIYVYNDFTHREQTVDAADPAGAVSGLKSDMAYKVAVKKNGKTLAEQEIRTKRPIPKLITQLRFVTHECTCNIDGMFRFTLDLIDQKNIWHDFSATLTDNYGNIGQCVFTDATQREQTIDVVGSELKGTTATFTVICRSRETNDREVILYQTTVRI